MEVYLLYHAHDLVEEVDVKLLGVYSSEQKAEEAKQRAGNKPGFSAHLDGFQIVQYEVDRDEWTDGYVSVQ